MSTLTKIIKRLGLSEGLKLYYRIKIEKPEVWHLKELRHPLYLRPGTSDLIVFKQIFGKGEYDISFPKTPLTIIDGGANIGLFSVLMTNRYPDAKIYSIEPDTGNYAQLKKNTVSYPMVTPIQAGIWNKSCFLKVIDEGLDQWGLQVKEAEAGINTGLKAITIGDIMDQYELEVLDVVKLDVEGAEAIIFQDNYEKWLSVTKTLIIELHDWNWPGISANFEKAISRYKHTKTTHGEYCIYDLHGAV
jgi:FkbM family methyltransferase